MVAPVVKVRATGRELEIEEYSYYGSESDLSHLEISGVPVIPNINTAILNAIRKGGRLEMSEWHDETRCGSVHCIAGWAVHLAGKAGYELEALIEDVTGDPEPTPAAAALIFAASGCPVIPDFYEENQNAMDALRHRAAQETKGAGE